MTGTWSFICFLVALILFILAALNVSAQRANLLAAGLAAFTLPFLFAAWPG